MELRVQVDQQSFGELDALLEGLGRDVSDLDAVGAWQGVSEVLSEEFEELFRAEGARGGPAWSRLAPATVKARKRLHYTPIRVGWASGRMAQSLISPTHPQALEVREPMRLTRGTIVGSKGFSYPAKFDEKRPILARLFSATNETVDRIVAAVERAVFKRLDRS